MRAPARHFGLPLLRKELQEQSAQRRTYVIRFVYGGLLFSIAYAMLYGQTGSAAAGVLGRGGVLFDQLLTVQFWGIFLFVPAMVSNAVTFEKERATFDLLRVTALRPWEIVLQKLLGRSVPVFTFVLLSLPLMAIAYSLGGVSLTQLYLGSVLLSLTCLQVGSLSIMCSAFFRTTPEAFVASYLGYPLLFGCCCRVAYPPFLMQQAADGGDLTLALATALPVTISIVVLLALATAFLEARANVPPRNFLLIVFRHLDDFWNSINGLTGGVVLVNEGESLPGAEPIAWRETAKKSLGTFRYLFRVLVVLELPILFVAQLLRIGNSAELGPLRFLLYSLWGVAAAMVAVHAAGVFSAERSRQTLDLLLSTPLTSAEILSQKFRGVRRAMCVLAVPFLSIYLFEFWWRQSLAYLGWSLLSLAVYLPLVAWLGLWVGLKLRSQTRAIISTMLLLIGWASLPWAADFLLATLFDETISGDWKYLRLLSPASVIPAIETRAPAEWGLPEPFERFYAINFALYAALLFAFRSLCLRDADRQLGRLAPSRLRTPDARRTPAP